MTKPLHQWSEYAGKTIKWLSPDSEENYHKNSTDPVKRQMLESFGWLDVEVNYTFNSHGFCTPEFDSRSNWLAIGCSFVQGTGINAQDRWTEIVSNRIDLHCWNLGVAGCAGDTCYRVASYYIPKLKPKFAVYLEPRYNRSEMKTMLEPVPMIINWAHDYSSWQGTYVKHLLSDSENFEIAAEKNREAIRSICQQHNIPLVVYSPDSYRSRIKDTTQLDLARDLLHPGRLNNRAFAQVVAEDIEQLC